MTEKKDNLVDGKYSIKDLLDLKKLQQIFEIFTKTTGTTIGLSSYPSQEILIAAGWKDICTKFHRRNPQSAQCCLKSNISMTKNLKKPGDISIVKCGNGMVDGAMPIIIKRKHIATLASGQVFFQPPDLEWFKKQAKKYGYDVKAYLKAVKEVSVVSKDQFKKTLTLLEELATLITHLGYGNLQIAEKNRELEEEIIERRRVEHDVLNANQEIELYKRLVEFAGDAVFKHTFDFGEILFVNRGFVDLLGLDCAPGQLKGKLLKDLVLFEEGELERLKELLGEKKEISNLECHFKTLKGEDHWVVYNSFLVRDAQTGQEIVETVVKDITQQKKTNILLAAEEERFRSMVENAPDGIFIQTEGRFVYLNKEVLRLFGVRDADQLLGHSILERIHPDFHAVIRERIRIINEEQKPVPLIDEKYLRLDGSQVNVEVSAAPYIYQHKKASLVFVRDISERKKAEAELKRERDKAQGYFDIAAVMFVVIDKEQKVMLVNKRTSEILEYDERQIIGRNWFDCFIPEPDRDKMRALFIKLLNAEIESGGSFENPILTKSGKKRIIRWRNTVLRDDTGHATGTLSSGEDITDEKMLEDTITENAERMFTVIENIEEGITFSDKKGFFEIFNSKMEQITGFSKEEANNHGNFIDLIYRDPIERLKALQGIEDIYKKGSAQEVETVIQAKDGRKKTLLVSTSLVHYKNEDMFLSVYRDISRYKKLEEIKNDFVSTVSHELRTPLSIIREGVSLVIDKTLGSINAEQEEALSHAKVNTERLTRIIDNLLDISKIETSKVEIKREPMDILVLIKEIVLDFGLKIKEKALVLAMDLPKKVEVINADRDRIADVLMNLIGNAVKFTEKGTITVSLHEEADYVECSVSDTGIGIAKQNLPKVFNKFQQFGRAWGPGEKGTGLGLAIVKGIIDLHGGKVWIESEWHEGTKVSFRLPKNI